MSDRLDEIEGRAEKATPGPWKVETETDYAEYGGASSTYVRGVLRDAAPPQWVVRFDDDYGTDQHADGYFIAHAREDIPYLLAEVRKLRAERERLREALEFYADESTYFAIAFMADPPCGDFMDDFTETDLGYKPGERAREALGIDA